ncbi:RND transporter [Cryobacterium melibiosiphilum]|uniref:RND transporter n=1 Tax=Cryobacterium melibiosiphilum TaxID=995039 RepID=A0A3A5MRP0_9MICO|nr:MMPL family transporter [Cryobacterium melibiosiphilum]RJT88054.1 RND transporter [Cryobacterium melibiosiphilum]
MAELLYKLGMFAARRAWTVIAAWIAVLALTVGGFLVGFGGLSSSFDIPGTASGAVTEQLADKLPDTSGASGTVVFTTTDGSEFSATQRAGISALAAGGSTLPDIATITDPFTSEQQRADQTAQLADGEAQIAAGRAQIDAGQAQLDAGRTALEASQAQLDQGRAQAVEAGFPTDQLDAQQAQLDAGLAEIDAQQTVLTDSLTDLEAQATTASFGAELLDLASGIGQVSADGSTALVSLAFSEPRLELAQESKNAVLEYFQSEPIDGVSVSFSTDIAQGVPELLGIGELIGVIIAAIVLLVMLGSVIAAALPIVTALFGVGVGAMAVLSFSGLVQMASVTPILGVMLGLAVGIDYSLFIINRHRKQLLQGADPKESIGLANGTAGNAVVFAGATVVVALLALNVTGVPFLALMGTAGAVSVFVAVLIAVTLTPAILGLLGRRLLGRKARTRIGLPALTTKPVKAMSTTRSVVTIVLAVAALLTIAIPSLSLRLGLPDGASEPAGSLSQEAFTVTEQQFGAGANGPLLVTAALPGDLSANEELELQALVARTLGAQADVAAVAPIAVSEDQQLAAFVVQPEEGPNSVSTETLVRELRDLPPISTGGIGSDSDIELGVAGQAASNIDISESLADVLPLYLVVVVTLSLLIMILVFRSLLVPLIATGGFILSLFATYGATVAVFQWGWGAELLGIQAGPILSFLPIILVGILFGLAMDYQLFLASGMREAFVHGAPARLAVAQGFRSGRSVVIAACLIMVAVFGGFIFSESTIIRSLGFGLAVGVLLDAFVVRMLLMPALMHLLGEAAWWLPRWLDRLLPNVDVEGAALERTHHLV